MHTISVEYSENMMGHTETTYPKIVGGLPLIIQSQLFSAVDEALQRHPIPSSIKIPNLDIIVTLSPKKNDGAGMKPYHEKSLRTTDSFAFADHSSDGILM
jgi:hypothetical protein